ncbi:syntaxin-binding protein 1 isoform X7 [Octopus vulgaris]|uniref:Syntaxin-binding protein 1 isoform X7 n=2 Tax=Octopus TaxID=6643 RepID=A0AA36AJ36_OCTVU|nr:syntaxin-binding protein 1 isoform X7 [Octopus vulgaris]
MHISQLKKKWIINDMQHLGVPIIQDGLVKNYTNILQEVSSYGTFQSNTPCQQGGRRKIAQPYHTNNRKERTADHTYQMSRWTPYIKDIMEAAVEDKLDTRHFPFFSGGGPRPSCQQPISVRYGHWHKDKGQASYKSGPRLIIFVVGGIAYSEMRSAYEVTQAVKNWEVILGATHILTPEGLLRDLRKISNP